MAVSCIGAFLTLTVHFVMPFFPFLVLNTYAMRQTHGTEASWVWLMIFGANEVGTNVDFGDETRRHLSDVGEVSLAWTASLHVLRFVIQENSWKNSLYLFDVYL